MHQTKRTTKTLCDRYLSVFLFWVAQDLNAQDTPTITLTKTSSSNQVTAGQTVDWTLLITNEAGLTPVTAENVEVGWEPLFR